MYGINTWIYLLSNVGERGGFNRTVPRMGLNQRTKILDGVIREEGGLAFRMKSENGVLL